MPADRPNLLILLSDQHNRNLLGCQGNRLVRTPHLDRLADGGVRFTDAYCPAPLCVPSRMSFMTGRTPSANRVWTNEHTLSSGDATWAHALGSAGYETSLIGRMHFVGPDQRHGFERRPMGEYMAGHHGRIWLGGPVWTRYPAITTGQKRVGLEHAGTGTTVYQWFDEHVTQATCDYLREQATAGRPFAAVAGFMLPHCPFIAPKALFDYYYDRVDVPEIEPGRPPTIQRFCRHRDILDPPVPPERVRVARAAYFALCEYLDGLIGRILDCLEQTGLADNTLVVYTSDHGECAGEHGCWWKSNYYEGSAGVPLIARLPGLTPAGHVCPAVCNLTDIAATLTQLAGAPDYPTDGRSLLPLLGGSQPDDWPNETFCEFVDVRSNGRDVNLPSRMIRSGPWKLWAFADSDQLPPALFNLDDDPEERRDLGCDPAFAAVRSRLLDRLYAGWDPAVASAASARQDRDAQLLKTWGKTVKPDHEDNLLAPPPSVEADIQLY